MVTVTINGTLRSDFGKTAAKNFRKVGEFPCVLYGTGENVHFTTTINEVRDLVYTPEFKLAEINVEGKSYTCILKSLQFDPVTDSINHIDFQQLKSGHPVKVEVPIVFEGSSPGVRAGGKFIPKLRTVKIKATPEALVDNMVANISKLRLGQSLRVRDIAPNAGIEILNAAALPIATISIPRGLKIGADDEEVEAVAE